MLDEKISHNFRVRKKKAPEEKKTKSRSLMLKHSKPGNENEMYVSSHITNWPIIFYRLEFGEFDRTNVQSNSPDSRLYIVD